MTLILGALLWFLALSAAIMAGIYFTFSVFGMRALAALGDEAGARAMQSINRVIVRTLFLPIFFLSSLASAAIVVLGLLVGGHPAWPMVAGGLVYLLGMFGVTVAGNVPLNNRLDAADPASAEGQAIWRDYLVRWTRLNHIRTLACVVALVLAMLALGAGAKLG